jgi:alkylation response protein AidB-like acyl-CoA dehydrogenase
MRFGFTEDQLMLRDTVREVLARECTPDVVRAAWEAKGQKVKASFETLAETGVLGMMLTEAQGGLGMSEIDAALPLEEAGYAALPEPLVEALAALPVIADHGGDAWTERLAAGEARLALSLGDARLVSFAETADVFLRYDGEVLFLAPREGVRLESQVSVDRTRAVAAPTFARDGVTMLAEGEEARDLAALVFDRAALGSALFLNGLSRKMLELAVEYAKDRVQFGKPIGSQQAVKHRLADALIALEFAKPLAYRAAHSLAHRDPERSLHVSLAKLRASEAARTVAKQALQVHGAIGYTIEHDLHLWMKRAWALSAAYGTEELHRDRIGRVILREE